MAKAVARSKLMISAERVGKALGRVAGRVDRLRGKRPTSKKTKGKRSVAAPIQSRRGSKAHLRTEATVRHDASVLAKAGHASERAPRKTTYRNQAR
jgi:hypothetical protein